jgi:glycosyltransferase involved in cell wall biosynthesis
VTEKLPWPLDDGGQIRSWHMLAALRREGPVTVLAPAPENPACAQALREQGIDLELFAARRSPAWKLWSLLRSLFTRRPHPLPKNHSSALLKSLCEHLGRADLRRVHFNHLDAAQYLLELGPLARGTPTSIDTHNLLTGLYQRLCEQTSNPLTRAYIHLQWRKMAAIEPRILRLAQRVLVCSQPEREQLRVWGVERVRVVPNGVDLERNQPAPPRTGEPRRLVFCGGMDYLPNADGVRWFLTDCWPRLVERNPALELLVVGRHPPPDLAQFGDRRVRFTGRVEDVREAVASGDFSIVPLRIGGGTRLKILESLALQRAVVSTRVGAEGLALENGTQILLADSAEEFCAAVQTLLDDPARREQLARAGQAQVHERYGWERVTAGAFDMDAP